MHRSGRLYITVGTQIYSWSPITNEKVFVAETPQEAAELYATDLRKFSPPNTAAKVTTDLCKFSRPPTIPFNTINTIYSANYYSAAEEEVGEEEEEGEEGGKVEKINLKMGRSAQPNLRSLVYLVYTAGNTFTDERSSTLYSSEKQ